MHRVAHNENKRNSVEYANWTFLAKLSSTCQQPGSCHQECPEGQAFIPSSVHRHLSKPITA